MKIHHIFFLAFGGLFFLWLFTGGPERIENQTSPFIRPPEDYIGSFEVYGDAELTEINETISEKNPFENWNPTQADEFSILLPQGWTHTETANFLGEKYGEIKKGETTIQYEFGKDINNFSRVSQNDHNFAEGKVGGHSTTFVQPKNSEGKTVGALIKKSDREKMLIYTNDEISETEKIEVFKIIQTVRF